jgi:hypothetical protein
LFAASPATTGGQAGLSGVFRRWHAGVLGLGVGA